jgi:hypothetical protein
MKRAVNNISSNFRLHQAVIGLFFADCVFQWDPNQKWQPLTQSTGRELTAQLISVKKTIVLEWASVGCQVPLWTTVL